MYEDKQFEKVREYAELAVKNDDPVWIRVNVVIAIYTYITKNIKPITLEPPTHVFHV